MNGRDHECGPVGSLELPSLHIVRAACCVLVLGPWRAPGPDVLAPGVSGLGSVGPLHLSFAVLPWELDFLLLLYSFFYSFVSC